MKKIPLIITVIVMISAGCKYEDGPLISLRSAKHRLYGGYTITKYTVNGIDSLSLYNDSLPTFFQFYYSDYDEVDICKIDGIRKDGKYCYLICTWDLLKNNSILRFKTVYGWPGTGTFGNGITPEWEILKLTNVEIRMKTTYNDKEYFVELK